MSKSTAQKIEAECKRQPFRSLRDLICRVPELQKDEISALAELGALNGLPKHKSDRHRRGALWQSELALQPVGNLLEPAAEETAPAPLAPMTPGQRTYADFSNSGVSIGKHPMAFHRHRMQDMGIFSARDAKAQRDGFLVAVAGCVITRQRPGTAKGFVFLSVEDETGIINIIVNPALFDRKREVCSTAPYILVKGVLQSISGVISVKAGEVESLTFKDSAVIPSHDFH